LFDDLRSLPVREAYYDAIACLSTLEHVGCDNSTYTGSPRDQENRPDDFVQAVQEFARVLKPGGRLFLTVPFGAYHHFGSFQQFDRALLTRAIAAFGSAQRVNETFYRYTSEGWQIATGSDCAACAYVEWVADVWSGAPWPRELKCEPDSAAAARAVACVTFIK
jgi:SAM-dependent methyltransferase